MQLPSIDWNESVVIDGVLRLPLYHGTSTLWMDSIRKNGLGGAMPRLEEVRALLGIINEHIPPERKDVMLEMMVNQEQGSMNWQHGQVYFSLAFEDAKNYALSNSFGSEILSECVKSAEEFDLLSLLPQWLCELRDEPKSPIVLKVGGVPIDWLELERRQEGEVVDKLEELEQDRLRMHREFDEVEAARAEFLCGNFERFGLASEYKGMTREDSLQSSMGVLLQQNTYRLKKQHVVLADSLDVIELL